MIRVKHCCCGCTVDIGARIAIWTDMIATIVVGLNIMVNTMRGNYGDDYVWLSSVFIIPVKLVILIGAVIGMNKKKASYLLPYVIFNVVAIITMGLLVVVAILNFDNVVESDLMKSLMANWDAMRTEYRHGKHNAYDDDNILIQPTRHPSPMNRPEAEHAVRVFCLIVAIIGGIVNFFLWTYFNIVLYSHYRNLLESGNFTNIDGVEYYAPTEQTGGKSVPQGAPSQYNIPPSYFASPPYPTQPYSQAPPAYDEATGPNAYVNPIPPRMQ